MRFLLFSLIGLFITCIQVKAQDTATRGSLTVWSEQGWMMKAHNNGATAVTFKFTWVTEGRNSAGDLVNSLQEESQELKLNPKEERHLFTAPQDPNKELTYVFVDINITEYHEETKEDLMKDKMNTNRRRLPNQ